MTTATLDFDAQYAAITGRDARFDGAFYTAVRTTGIYCRPSCPAPKPKAANVDFYPSAAACQAAGYRACRRCVPEALPGSPLWSTTDTVVARALRLIDDGVVDEQGVTGLAERVGYSTRTLTRVLTEQTGAPPIAHARARRARLAHGLITSTDLTFAGVAFAAGFTSIRQFNDTVRQVYGATPTQLRATAGGEVAAGRLRAHLGYRGPLPFGELLRWFAIHAVRGVETVTDGEYCRTLALPHGPGVVAVRDDAPASRVVVDLHLADLRDYGPACAAVRRMLDLDADPAAVAEGLGAVPWLAGRVAARPGLRAPGCSTPEEAVLRALTGQQMSLESALQQMDRLASLGPKLPAALRREGLSRVLPGPAVAAERCEGWFKGPGGRRDAIRAAMEASAAGRLDAGHDLAEVEAQLHGIRGVGPWTVAYTLMRGYQAPDVDLAGDGALLAVARRSGIADTPRALREALAATSPWRSYAAMYLWTDALAGRPATRPPLKERA